MLARSERILRIFLASPGDLELEREAVKSAVDEINEVTAPLANARLELIRWKTHTIPALGADPQDIINKQIGNEYEIFIGLLWTKFGTATPRAESGTVEEFERAKARWLADPDSVSVMFYFKEEPLSPKDIDAEQLVKVQRFKKELGSTALYHTFVTAEDLARLVRISLSRHVHRQAQTPKDSGISHNREQNASNRAVSDSVDERSEPDEGIVPTREDDENDGLFDFIDRATSGFDGSQQILTNMTQNMTALTEHIQEATVGIQRTKSDSGQIDNAQAKKIVNDFADKITIVSSRFEADIPAFKTNFASAIDAFIRGTELSTDFGESGLDAVKNNRESIITLAQASQSSIPVVEGLRASIDNLPRITNHFNRARKRLSAALASVHREFLTANSLVNEALAAVDQTIRNSEVHSIGNRTKEAAAADLE